MARRTRQTEDAPAPVPTREAVLRFIAENPSRATKRDIAKTFDVKGDARIDLKLLLKELESEGLIERRGKRVSTPGALLLPGT